MISVLLKLLLLNCVMNTQSLLDILRVELAKDIIKGQPQTNAEGYQVSAKIEGLSPQEPKTVGQIGFRT
jgi:hypothetical protein